MSVEDYSRHTPAGNTDIVENPVECQNADVSSTHSATLRFKKLSCLGNAKISVDHSATLVISHLVCASAEINLSYASKLVIDNFECTGTVKIYDGYSSTLQIDAGSIDKVTGKVEYSSTGICYAKIKRDEVSVEWASTWKT